MCFLSKKECKVIPKGTKHIHVGYVFPLSDGAFLDADFCIMNSINAWTVHGSNFF